MAFSEAGKRGVCARFLSGADTRARGTPVGSRVVGCLSSPRRPFQVRLLPAPRPVLQKRTQPVASARVTQLPQRLRLNLPDTLPCHREILAHLFKRVLAAVFQAEPHLDDLLFARGERLQHLRGLLAKIRSEER